MHCYTVIAVISRVINLSCKSELFIHKKIYGVMKILHSRTTIT